MSRALLVITDEGVRARAINWCAKADIGTRIEFKKARRTIPQNDRMWAMLTDIAAQLPWHGVRLSPADWKLIFLDSLKTEMRLVPNIAGNGFVNLGRSSSDLSKEEMGDLMTVIEMFAAAHEVKLHDPDDHTGQLRDEPKSNRAAA